MRASRAFVSALALAASPALARQSLHDIPWYMSHSEERRVTINLCRNDAGMARLPDCANAEMAETRLRAESLRPGADALSAQQLDPQYWVTNRIARAGMLNECRLGLSDASPGACAAARAAEAMDGLHGR